MLLYKAESNLFIATLLVLCYLSLYNGSKYIAGVNEMPRDGYMTIDEIAQALNVRVAKVRTIIARLGIQPTRFPDDMRKLYYNTEDVQRIREALGL